MKINDVAFKAYSVRRRPVLGHTDINSYNMFVRVEDIPGDFPDENVRSTTDSQSKQVYKELRETLLGDDGQEGSFVFKNLGIRVLAEGFSHDEKTGIVTLKNARTPNGAHTLTIVKSTQDELRSKNEQRVANGFKEIVQCLDIRVDVGTPVDWETEIVQANNNTVGVKKLALAENKNLFDWMKVSLKEGPEDFAELVDFKDEGSKEINISDLLCVLSLFNVGVWPNEGYNHPVSGYSSAHTIAKLYLDESKKEELSNWRRLAPILKDILILRDMISSQARDLYNLPGDKKGARLSFVINTDRPRTTKSGKQAKALPKLKYAFLGIDSQYGLLKGALIPMLAAFRALVVTNDQGMYVWAKDFDHVVKTWNKLGGTMMETLKSASNGGQTSIDSVAKNSNTWKVLHQEVFIERIRSIGI